MKHITVCDYGQFIGVTSERLTIKEDGVLVAEYPLGRIKTVTITKKGVSLSSNVIVQCAMRGIKLFILDPFSHTQACVSGGQLHAVSKVREQQFKFLGSDEAKKLAQSLVIGKLKNQRVILNYFAKYQKKHNQSHVCQLSASKLKTHIAKVQQLKIEKYDDWREVLLGYEGSGAAMYWKTLYEANLFPDSFSGRTGRGATDPINSALNYGYHILSTYVWHCLINSGLEIYQGVLHTQRAGKPSLVLDIMEVYRAWVVDRNVIKMADKLQKSGELTPKIKKQLIASIHKTFATHYPYQGKKLKLETILQRQIYRLSGAFYGEKKYKPYIFRW
ncbi:CRISPR-associated endonuclease Cas1 [Vibrio splendidus]|uniref:CRISPR-associated endonuclease Cas1 n=1 Tax=Vibrio splendidus TaxID=29497 RepID=A0A2N7JQ13_VIBSP|nr:CRISPR-associated endonuclease Cas1 [Vibrio splendidus]PMM50267.1 CRISPR-associated endonuclease Cas1 [Vibrio splendidus]